MRLFFVIPAQGELCSCEGRSPDAAEQAARRGLAWAPAFAGEQLFAECDR